MANSIGLRPIAPEARVVLTQARENMNIRLETSKRLVTLFNNAHLEGNQKIIENPAVREVMQSLVTKTAALSKAIATLEEAGVDAGVCKITVQGKVYGTKQISRSVADVNEEIQSNLDQEVVKVGLRSLGIEAAPKKLFFSLNFSMPAMPSNRTLATAAGAVIGTAAVGSGIYFRAEVAKFVADHTPATPQFIVNFGDFVSTKTGEVRDFVTRQFPDCAATPDTNFCSAKKTVEKFFADRQTEIISAKDAAITFVNGNKILVGSIGAGLVVLGGIAIYKVVQNRKKQQEEAQTVNVPVETPVVEETQTQIA